MSAMFRGRYLKSGEYLVGCFRSIYFRDIFVARIKSWSRKIFNIKLWPRYIYLGQYHCAIIKMATGMELKIWQGDYGLPSVDHSCLAVMVSGIWTMDLCCKLDSTSGFVPIKMSVISRPGNGAWWHAVKLKAMSNSMLNVVCRKVTVQNTEMNSFNVMRLFCH